MLEDISGEQLKNQFKTNKKLRMTTMIVGGLIVAVVGYFVYVQFIWSPKNEKSKDNYWVGLNYATADSTDLALDELNAHVKNYDGKVGGEVAQFVYARQLMAKREFQKAIEQLESVDLSDTYVSVMAIGLKADCLSELKKYEEAANLYLEVADMDDNELTTPMYLMKAGLCAEELNDFEMATTCYKRIKSDYTAFASQRSIEKYIARAENQKAK